MRGYLLALVGVLVVGCNFDQAFDRYCRENGKCRFDAALEARPEPGPEAGPEPGPEAGPEPGPEAGPEPGPEAGPEAPDAALPPRDGRFEKIPPPEPESCMTSADCSQPESFCHPIGHVCLKTCNSGADCPSYHDQCEVLEDPGTSGPMPKVCTCSGPVACSSYADNYTCNLLDGICEKECRGPEDCSNFQPSRFCVDKYNVCVVMEQNCYSNLDCLSPSRPHCDTVSRRCGRCGSNNDCSERTDGLLRCSPDGGCVAP
jgi:hypothetical protein